NKTRDLQEYVKWFSTDELYKALRGKSRDELGEWFRENRPWIRAGAEGTLMLDEEARDFGTSAADPAFFDKAIRALVDTGDRGDLARKLLGRYAPEGPGEESSRDKWIAWHAENRAYLFFSDTGGYRWYVDPLAKARKIPTEKLRGSDRASRPALA